MFLLLRFRLFFYILGKENLYKVIKDILADRKKNPPAEGEEAVIDMIMKYASSEEEAKADVLSYVIAGFHTSGLCKLLTCLMLIYC